MRPIKKTMLALFKNKLPSLLMIIFSLFSLASGSLSRKANSEYASKYASVLATNYTNNGRLASLIVQPKPNSHAEIPSQHSEYLSTYGLFGPGTALYAGVVNGDKKHNVFVEKFGSMNYSFLVADFNSNFKYNGNYRHEFYNLYLMFPGFNRFDACYSFCYISQSDANVLLDRKGQAHTEENYKNLIKSDFIDVNIDGVNFKFSVGNIYLENGYYYRALKDTIGDFMLSFTKFPKTVQKQSLYMLSEYDYHNKYIMEHVKDLYGPDTYEITLNEWNLKNKDDIKYDIVEEFFFEDYSTWKTFFSILSLVFAIAILLLFSLLVFFRKISCSLLNAIFLPFIIFIFYLATLLVSLSVKPFLLFNSFSSSLLLIGILFVPIYLLALSCIRQTRSILFERYPYYEVNV